MQWQLQQFYLVFQKDDQSNQECELLEQYVYLLKRQAKIFNTSLSHDVVQHNLIYDTYTTYQFKRILHRY